MKLILSPNPEQWALEQAVGSQPKYRDNPHIWRFRTMKNWGYPFMGIIPIHRD